ncbi:MAG: helicase-related protein [Gammaproteobacteria bacterium]|nr:helicase-related protein [Gammaproteobacteria bacterium]
MALKMDPVRLLIADDVGVGKTIEACLVARELIDRGEANRLAVVCPPHLAEQWQAELADKFHLPAELVLASTASTLERDCRTGESLFERYPYTVVSLDFIKTERRRHEFLRTCPDLVIVDEAHTCADPSGEGRRVQHQRHQVVKQLSEKKGRHLILVTATPHSGKEAAFRSLLTLLKPEFSTLPEDLSGRENERTRRQLANHFVQRRRGKDIQNYLDTETPFPERIDRQVTYSLSGEYKKLFDDVLRYVRQSVRRPEGETRHRRIRWWSALALLQSLASSPLAAASTLRKRSTTKHSQTDAEVEDIGRHTVMDLVDESSGEGIDVSPGALIDDLDPQSEQHRQQMLRFARAAEKLEGQKDNKLQLAIKNIKSMLKEGLHPIIFCRFIATAEYVEEALRQALPNRVQVIAVTGRLPAKEREDRVKQLSQFDQRVLVCTDCLSEGINLQESFDAVFHYDLSWNPTRHEQREGRVDRYGQQQDTVSIVTYYGIDNQIDGLVLEVLFRKHKQIRSSLGISIPVPAGDQVAEAIFEGLLLREDSGGSQQFLPGFDEEFKAQTNDVFRQWDRAAERERRSRTMFAQHAIDEGAVADELKAVQSAIGSGEDVETFFLSALKQYGGVVEPAGTATYFDLSETPAALRDRLNDQSKTENTFTGRFQLPVKDGQIYLHRTHPKVEALATYLMDTALDPISESLAGRAGVTRTSGVEKWTTALLLRFRFHLQRQQEQPLLAEDCQLVAFKGSAENADWLAPEQTEGLLQLAPSTNMAHELAQRSISRVLENLPHLRDDLDLFAREKADQILAQHQRVRDAARARGRYRVEPILPVDILGLYLFLPVPQI